MTTAKVNRAKYLAEQHWSWQRQFLKEVAGLSDEQLDKLSRVAIDYFIHGYKHGCEESTQVQWK